MVVHENMKVARIAIEKNNQTASQLYVCITTKEIILLLIFTSLSDLFSVIRLSCVIVCKLSILKISKLHWRNSQYFYLWKISTTYWKFGVSKFTQSS